MITQTIEQIETHFFENDKYQNMEPYYVIVCRVLCIIVVMFTYLACILS